MGEGEGEGGAVAVAGVDLESLSGEGFPFGAWEGGAGVAEGDFYGSLGRGVGGEGDGAGAGGAEDGVFEVGFEGFG